MAAAPVPTSALGSVIDEGAGGGGGGRVADTRGTLRAAAAAARHRKGRRGSAVAVLADQAHKGRTTSAAQSVCMRARRE